MYIQNTSRYLRRGLEVEFFAPGVCHDGPHEWPEVLGVAAEWTICKHSCGPLPRGVWRTAVGRVDGHGAGCCRLVSEHATERSRCANAASNVAPESDHRAGRSDLHRDTRENTIQYL